MEEEIKRKIIKEFKEELIKRIRYSSIYNISCPEWVYRLIENVW